MRALSKQPGFLKKARAASLLFTWGHLANFDEVKDWLHARLEDDDVVLKVAALMPSEVYSSPGGLWYRIDRQGWSLLLDVDDFTKTLRVVGKTRKDDPAAVEVLKAYEDALKRAEDA